MTREWKFIEGFDNRYLISNYGEVYGFHLNKMLKIKKKKGYDYVALSKNNKTINKRVHRLIAECFIPNPEGKPFINHIDSVRDNNSIDNLEWCTPMENSHHMISQGRQFTTPVRCIELDIEKVSTKAMARFMISEGYIDRSEHLVSNGISKCVRGDSLSSYGYTYERI